MIVTSLVRESDNISGELVPLNWLDIETEDANNIKIQRWKTLNYPSKSIISLDLLNKLKSMDDVILPEKLRKLFIAK